MMVIGEMCEALAGAEEEQLNGSIMINFYRWREGCVQLCVALMCGEGDYFH